jgi:hypothetical protein
VDWLCTRNNWQVEYYEFTAPYKDCQKRILAQEQRSLAATKDEHEKDKIKRATQARLTLLDKYHDG